MPWKKIWFMLPIKHKVGGFFEFSWCDLEVLVEPSKGLAADQLVAFRMRGEGGRIDRANLDAAETGLREVL